MDAEHYTALQLDRENPALSMLKHPNLAYSTPVILLAETNFMLSTQQLYSLTNIAI